MRLLQTTIWGGVIMTTGLMTQLVIVTAQVQISEPAPVMVEYDHFSPAGVCLQIGLTPVPLTMAGIIPGQVQPMLVELQDADALRQELLQLATTADELGQAITHLSEALFVDPTLPGLAGQHESATEELSGVQAQMAQIREELFELSTTGLTPAQRQVLQACQDSAERRVPAEFKVLAQSEQQWAAIEQALIAEARALRLDEPVPADAAALLGQIRNEHAVVAAQQALAVGLDVMDAQFTMLTPQFAGGA